MSNTTDLKGSSFTLSVLHLADHHVATAVDFLKQKAEQAPAFFANAPIVLNINKVAEELDFNALKQGIIEAGFVPVGVTGCKDKRRQRLAHDAGLAVMSASHSSSQAPANIAPTKVVHTPIRSGQQVYAKNGDLVILNHVSPGAEVIADGSIHIHGILRGRAIAGASGQKQAKIICHDLQAELVSIAGNYWLSEQIDSQFWQSKVMLSLNEESLHFELLSI